MCRELNTPSKVGRVAIGGGILKAKCSRVVQDCVNERLRIIYLTRDLNTVPIIKAQRIAEKTTYAEMGCCKGRRSHLELSIKV